MRYVPAVVGVNVKVAEWPGLRPVVGSGVDAPAKAGVVSPAFFTIAHECGIVVDLFLHTTVTFHPVGTVTTRSPFAYPSKLYPPFAEPSAASSVSFADFVDASDDSQCVTGTDAGLATGLAVVLEGVVVVALEVVAGVAPEEDVDVVADVVVVVLVELDPPHAASTRAAASTSPEPARARPALHPHLPAGAVIAVKESSFLGRWV